MSVEDCTLLLEECFEGCEPDVGTHVIEAAFSLRGLEAVVEEMSLPMHSEGKGQQNKGFYPLSLQEAYARGIKARLQELSETVSLITLLTGYVSRNYQNRFYTIGKN
ncbi:hypothetical protein CHS0354_007583 [Potamilus streckersoni]|uniref:Uncharacterized protein n=1 Tax=Potamilus streckersoni TaxID=2493646 RepID=A0AAE0T458_9BIVA|nr:hypothetical protein CHS0354_007583 [Potamilus streckersoni]